MDPDSIRSILVMLVLVVMSAYFSATETAFSTFNRIRIKNAAENGSKRAALVLKMSEDYDRLLSTILVGNNLVNILLTTVATLFFATKIMDEDWAAAKQKADEVYNTFLAGDKTEASFGELAKLHSGDGNAAQGGIYEGVYPGQMVKTFNDWCFDDSRKPGDTGIVETDFGYHIMYYVAQSEEIYWQKVVAQDLVNEQISAKLDELARSYVLFWQPEQTAISLPGQIAATSVPVE